MRIGPVGRVAVDRCRAGTSSSLTSGPVNSSGAVMNSIRHVACRFRAEPTNRISNGLCGLERDIPEKTDGIGLPISSYCKDCCSRKVPLTVRFCLVLSVFYPVDKPTFDGSVFVVRQVTLTTQFSDLCEH